MRSRIFFPTLIFIAISSCSPKEINAPCGEVVVDVYRLVELAGIKPYIDIHDAIDCAEETGRPVFLFIYGFAVFSTHQPWEIFEDRQIRRMIDDHFVICVLMVDDKRLLPSSRGSDFPQIDSAAYNVGQWNSEFQEQYFHTSNQPLMAVVNAKMESLHDPIGWEGRSTIQRVREMLTTVISKE